VNCAALPESLIEAELFGYDEGAFTGARKRGVPGRIREAHGGVLFLDEIADMPLAMQTRLLRVLEERVVTPLGGGPGVAVDFDLVCATHGDLAALAAQRRFRSDLLYRVAGFSVKLPALRERADRVALISRLFIESGGAAKTLRLDETALVRLTHYRWPGNVRELRSVLKSITALADPGDTISVDQLPDGLRGAPTMATVDSRDIDVRGHAPEALNDIERQDIDAALGACQHNVAAAARQLGVHRSTVYRHLARRRSDAPDDQPRAVLA
jgi:transcriptional regulator of acetoin/glycerol metabolism